VKRLAASLVHRVARHPLARQLREAAQGAGVDVWLVGGFVRDAALSAPSHDIDLVCGGPASRLIRDLESRWGKRGFRFRRRGVTTWRFAVGDSAVDIVDAARRGLHEDLRRRDFTVNAVAFDVVRRTVSDPLRGLEDLRAGRLRLCRRDAVRDDPLRALRAVRFLAQFPEWRLLPAARAEVAAVAPRLCRVAVERVREELNRLLLSASPSRGLRAATALGLIDPLLPELSPMRDCVAGRDRPDVWRHTLDAIALTENPGQRRLPGHRVVRDDGDRRRLRWSLLLHDISKPETLAHRPEDGRPSFHGHEALGAGRAEGLLSRLRCSRPERRRIARLVSLHLRPGHLADAGPTARGLRRLVRDAGEDLPVLVLHAACDALASGSPDARPRWRRLRTVLTRLLELRHQLGDVPPPLLLNGLDVMRRLGVAAGPRVGEILRQLREKQDAGTLRTRRQALAWLVSLESVGR